MSTLTTAMIVNGIVLFTVLEADLGPHRTIGRFRILRPLLTAAAIVPLFIEAFATSGTGLLIEVAGTLAGLAVGALAMAFIRVYRSPKTGRPASRAGFAYATLWTVVIGARAAFSYGSVHWFGSQLQSWAISNHVTGAAITDALILMAVAMSATRTIGLGVRAATAGPVRETRPAVAHKVSQAVRGAQH